MTYKKRTIFYAVIIFLLLISIAASMLFMTITIAKVVDQQSSVWGLNSHSFYFLGDVVDVSGNDIYYQNEFDIELYNYDSEFTTYDIEYEIVVSNIATSGNDTITISDPNNGTLTGNAQSSSIITVTPHSDITSFIITINTVNGYLKSLYANCYVN